MKHSRRKQFNPINAPSLARWIVITAFLGLIGLIYVYLNVQLYHEGNKKKALEIELGNLHSENTTASGQITTLTSRVALQRRLKEGYLENDPDRRAKYRSLERARGSAGRRRRSTNR